MKKSILITVVLAMTLGLCACSSSEKADGLQVGFSKVNITPSTPQPLGGYGDDSQRISQEIMDEISATCIAVTSGEETVLMFTVDTLNANHEDAEEYRKVITEETGIPGEKIFIGATHCHSSPSDSGAYRTSLKQWLVDAAKGALADRSAATMQAATPTFEKMNFVRHYKMSDGSYAGSNFGSFTAGEIVGHAVEADTQAVLVKFDRADDKKDILMVNWQAHPDMSSDIGYYNLAPSFVGPLRNKVEEETGMLVAYFTGASGNLNPTSKIISENHNLGWRGYGEKMGELIAEATGDMQTIEGTAIRTARVMQEVSVDHSWDHMVPEANEVFMEWQNKGKAAGDLLGKQYDFSSVYQARAIRTRAGMPATQELEMNVFSIGGIGFTTGTYEMFTESSKYVKENSPFAVTFLIAGNSGYIPTKAAYDYRSYEADTGYFVQGTAEMLAEKYVQMLKEIS